ncbi:MAG TPA: FAD-dependent oxidoreductase, partial [Verrucomicrobiae bacterium]
MTHDCAIIGGGIVGLATAMTLLQMRPGTRVVVLEKEESVAQHQSGRNSGVIHSGIYYKPGSLKARMAREGNRSMREFCARHEIPFEVCGKLIVATEEHESPLLDHLFERAQQNGLAVEKLAPEAAREVEPHARCLAALRLPSTGIVSYRAVALRYATLIHDAGGALRFGTRVESVRDSGNE